MPFIKMKAGSCVLCTDGVVRKIKAVATYHISYYVLIWKDGKPDRWSDSMAADRKTIEQCFKLGRQLDIFELPDSFKVNRDPEKET